MGQLQRISLWHNFRTRAPCPSTQKLQMPPSTRSSSRLANSPINTVQNGAPNTVKRKPSLSEVVNSKKARQSAKDDCTATESQLLITGAIASGSLRSAGNEDTPVPAILTFEFEAAKSHLIGVDSRFQDLFSRMPCRPFEQFELVHPFRALTISILGQQISWKAAGSITHKFIRLYNPSIPEEATDESKAEAMKVFPSPYQVVSTDVALLRTAGLSARKAEYIQDLAGRFADGRLSTEKLQEATDEELGEMLIQVKGIGRWTVDMFAIFSLRRPDILPVGDLGIQRGMVRWFLSQHSSAHPYGLSPEKVGGASGKSNGKKKAKMTGPSAIDDENALPEPERVVNTPAEADTEGVAADLESTLGETSLLPLPLTPSIRKTLGKAPKETVPLPTGLTVSVLKGRLDGKKIKGAFLTPQEMTDLTESWKPYRSLGVYYMWSLAAPVNE